MSIQSQIDRLKNAVSAAYTAAQSKGATMPSAQTAANLAAAVQSIPDATPMTVDSALSGTSTNPVQNKVVKAALDEKLDKSGGTLTGNLTGKYLSGTWLQTTDASDLGSTPGKVAVLDGSGWVYYRTPSELRGDMGIQTGVANVKFSSSVSLAEKTQVTFAKAYSNKPVVFVQQVFDTQNCIVKVGDVSTTGFTISVPKMASSGTRQAMWIAVGN